MSFKYLIIFILTMILNHQAHALTTSEIIDTAAGSPQVLTTMTMVIERFGLGDIEGLKQIVKHCPGARHDGEFHGGPSPTLCLKEGLSDTDTFIILAHEMVHGARYEFKFDSKWSLDEFVWISLEGPGGEIEAYSAQVDMIRYLRSIGLTRNLFEVEVFFDEKGDLKDRPGLTFFILETLGYQRYFEAQYVALKSKRLKKPIAAHG